MHACGSMTRQDGDSSEIEQVAGECCKGGGSVLQQEVAIAEAPEHTDAGQAGIAGSQNVNIAVADIDSR